MAGDKARRFGAELDLLIRARCPALYVVTWEEGRLESLLFELARRQGKRLYVWTRSRGLQPYTGERPPRPDVVQHDEPAAVLAEIQRQRGPGLFLLKDFHTGFDDAALVRLLKDTAGELKQTRKTLLISAPELKLPVELEKELTVLDLPLPGPDELRDLLRSLCVELRRADRDAVQLEAGDAASLVQAARGLTLSEAENAFAKAAVSHGALRSEDVELVMTEKRQVIRKSGSLEFHPPDITLADVGGLGSLKDWLRRRGKAWRPEAEAFGLPKPRGVLLLGVPGCGKSLTARAVAQAWTLPLLHLDLGRVFSGLLGGSEQNMRRALAVAEGIAPAVLWIDEIEKGLAGGTGSGTQDAGTAVRVFGTLLTWMQERTAPVFVVATANRIDALPPELLRRGRFDEIFFVDLPSVAARAEILAIHLAKRGREPTKFDLSALATAAAGFSGSELEHCVVEALFSAFDADREVDDGDLLAAISETVPLSKTSSDSIEALRAWAATRARPAEGAPAQLYHA